MATERAINFSDEMIRALLDGRKTQTRRVVKLSDVPILKGVHRVLGPYADGGFDFVLTDESGSVYQCPFGKPRDRLWVQEAWAMDAAFETRESSAVGRAFSRWFRADDSRAGPWNCNDTRGRWRPAKEMSRLFSRITLEITDVRVERLQQITTGGYLNKSDVQREGCPFENDPAQMGFDEAAWFSQLWDSLHANKPGCSWADSPWVWVISFKRLPSE